MSALQVVALISGGKDSFFSMLHCLANGHQIVALANLYPANVDDIDTDSFMYQTIGHNVIPLYAKALQLPLYRAPILGSATRREQTYQQASGSGTSQVDETESLTSLLRNIIAKHPAANAVSAGAILSSYQRTRIESVALRLDLVPLAFLWQYPYLPPYTQASLLHDMAVVGQESRIIKVASGGLDDRHLWLDVSDSSSVKRLGRDMSRFGVGEVGAVLGEGGEYETLSLDGPNVLWKDRLVINGADSEMRSLEGGSAIVIITKADVENKSHDIHKSRATSLDKLRLPSIWDDEFAELLQISKDKRLHGNQPSDHKSGPSTEEVPTTTKVTTKAIGEVLYLANLMAPSEQSVFAQTVAIVGQIQAQLKARDLDPSNIAFTTILLRNMDDFAEINKIYANMFSTPNPPARVTVACGDRLPSDVRVMMSLITHITTWYSRHALHVQSRSYWAPANIGPYSQAVAVPVTPSPDLGDAIQLVYVAGQIPLVPVTMTMVSDDFIEQAVLSLQHLWRIGRTMKVQYWVDAVIYITATSKDQSRERAILASRIWQRIHAITDNSESVDDDDFDIGDHNLHRSWHKSGADLVDYDKTPRTPLPDWDALRSLATAHNLPHLLGPPPYVIVQVSQLPRGAPIEWSAVGKRYVPDLLAASSKTDTTQIGRDSIEKIRTWDGHKQEAQKESLSEIYTTTIVPDTILEECQPMVVPCSAIFDEAGNEYVAAKRTRYYT